MAGHWKCSLSPWLLSPYPGPSSKRVKVSVSDQQSSATAADGTSAGTHPSFDGSSRGISFIIIREYGSTLYVGMTRVKNGGQIKRVH